MGAQINGSAIDAEKRKRQRTPANTQGVERAVGRSSERTIKKREGRKRRSLSRSSLGSGERRLHGHSLTTQTDSKKTTTAEAAAAATPLARSRQTIAALCAPLLLLLSPKAERATVAAASRCWRRSEVMEVAAVAAAAWPD